MRSFTVKPGSPRIYAGEELASALRKRLPSSNHARVPHISLVLCEMWGRPLVAPSQSGRIPVKILNALRDPAWIRHTKYTVLTATYMPS
jgi:hypothetical protein